MLHCARFPRERLGELHRLLARHLFPEKPSCDSAG
jgi:hypothetical protein